MDGDQRQGSAQAIADLERHAAERDFARAVLMLARSKPAAAGAPCVAFAGGDLPSVWTGLSRSALGPASPLQRPVSSRISTAPLPHASPATQRLVLV